MRLISQADLMLAFDPIDQPQVVAPTQQWTCWNDLEFFSWQHPSEALAYLVFPLAERNVGLVLRPSSAAASGMCELCLGFDREQGTRLFMAENWLRPRRKQGIHICANLNCSDTVRGGSWVYRMSETIPVGRRIERLTERTERFVRGVCGLQAKSGAA